MMWWLVSELVCKAGVGEEWGRKLSLARCLKFQYPAGKSKLLFSFSNSASHEYGVKEGLELVCKPLLSANSPPFLTV